MDFQRLRQKDIAKCFGVSTRTIQAWTDAGMPRNADDSYSASECFAWKLSQRATGDAGDLDPAQELARKNAALADKTEMENSVRRAQLAEMPLVVAAWADHVAAARAKLLSMPTKLGPQLVNVADPNAIAAGIRNEVHAAIDELAAWEPKESDPDLQGDDERAGDMEEPATADRKPVGRRKKTAQ